jgi:hypothetical protein
MTATRCGIGSRLTGATKKVAACARITWAATLFAIKLTILAAL